MEGAEVKEAAAAVGGTMLTLEAGGEVIPKGVADAALLCDSGLMAHLLGAPGADDDDDDDDEGGEEGGEEEGEEEGEEDCEWELEGEDEGSGEEGRLGSSAASSSAAVDSGFMEHLLQQPWQPAALEPPPPREAEAPPSAPAAAAAPADDAAAAEVSVAAGGPWRDAARRDASRPLRESEGGAQAGGAPAARAVHAPAQLASASDVGALSLRDVELLGGDRDLDRGSAACTCAATAPALGSSLSGDARDSNSSEQQRKKSGVAAAVKRVGRSFARALRPGRKLSADDGTFHEGD